MNKNVFIHNNKRICLKIKMYLDSTNYQHLYFAAKLLLAITALRHLQ